jgi:hypothetical protein
MVLLIPQAIPSPLAFVSADTLLIAHNHTIYYFDVTTSHLEAFVPFSDSSLLEDIAYNDKRHEIWVTRRYGSPDQGTYNDLLIIPNDRSQDIVLWDPCSHISIAPHCNSIVTLHSQDQTRPGRGQEPPFVCESSQLLTYFPSISCTADKIVLMQSLTDDSLDILNPLNIRYAEVSDNTSTVLINTFNGMVFLWNPTTQVVKNLYTHLSEHLHFGTLSPNGQWVFIVSSTKGLLLSLNQDRYAFLPKPIESFGNNEHTHVGKCINRATFSPDNKYLLIISCEQEKYLSPGFLKFTLTPLFMLIFNLETLTIEHAFYYIFASTDYPCEAGALAPGGRTIATLSAQGILRIIDAETQKSIAVQLRDGS